MVSDTGLKAYVKGYKDDYAHHMKHTIEKQENLLLKQAIVEELIVEDGEVKGVVTHTGAVYRAGAVVITAGTSSRGKIIIGDLVYSSGPNNSQPSIKLSENLLDLGFELARFKTGTPPRVMASSIDYSKTEEQPGDVEPNHFSFLSKDEDYLKDQLSCWLTYTSPESHEIIRDNLHTTTRDIIWRLRIKSITHPFKRTFIWKIKMNHLSNRMYTRIRSA